MKNKGVLAAGVLAVSMLSGCASIFNPADTSEFSCPGMPLGVVCATPLAVYEMTNGDGQKSGRAAPGSPQPVVVPQVAPAVATAGLSTDAAALRSDTKAQYAAPQTPQPLREPARVMRVWIKPWIDSNDDLHWPSYVYTEIVPRKWTVGKKEFAAMRALNVPHFAATPVPSPAVTDRSAPNTAGTPAALPTADSISLN